MFADPRVVVAVSVSFSDNVVIDQQSRAGNVAVGRER